MKQRPILFKGPMVRALLDGSKTQTRRVVKPQPMADHQFVGGHYIKALKTQISVKAPYVGIACPYGRPGDQLWVRESHWYFKDEHDPVTGYFPPALELDDFEYRADGDSDRHGWFPSIHMPRIGSRITLEITGVRVERLQDISDADAVAEGIEKHPSGLWLPCSEKGKAHIDPKRAYRDLWESINGPGSWNANPWVWVVEFKRVSTA